MASIANDGGKRWRIQFFDAEGNRKTIRLRDVSKADVNEWASGIDRLIQSASLGNAPEPKVAEWLAALDDGKYRKLVKHGLAQPRGVRVVRTVAEFIDGYIADRTDAKPRTIINLKAARKELVEHFGADKPLGSISEGDADEFERYLRRARETGENKRKALGSNTARRVCGRAKQFFRAAVRKRLIDANPFTDLKTQVQASAAERDFFITPDIAGKVLAKCPDTEWKLIFALSRWGGLRCPSEHLALKWADIDFDNGRMTIHSPKTEHHEGKETRLMPIFPELRTLLEQAQGEQLLASEGGEHVIARHRDCNANLRTGLRRIIKRAGLEPWPKLFHNLRATRETELAETFPGHVVSEWIGNSEKIARKHYLRVTDAHFEKAAQKAAQQTPTDLNNAPQNAPPVAAETIKKGSATSYGAAAYPQGGQNNPAVSDGISTLPAQAAQFTAHDDDSDLRDVIDRWPALSPEQRAAVLSIIRQR